MGSKAKGKGKSRKGNAAPAAQENPTVAGAPAEIPPYGLREWAMDRFGKGRVIMASLATGLLIILGIMGVGAMVFGGGAEVELMSSAGVCQDTASGRTMCAPQETPKGGQLVLIDSDGVRHYDNGGRWASGRGFYPGPS